jgi:probable HAF family extracellular repeat protein
MFSSKKCHHFDKIIMLAAWVVALLAPKCGLAGTATYTVLQLSTGADQVPTHLNSSGDVVGRAGGNSAIVWNHGTLQRNSLGASPAADNSAAFGDNTAAFGDYSAAFGDYSAAFGINDMGQVVGAANTASNNLVPFLWTPGAGVQNISLLPGDNCGQAFGINTSGHVAGYSSGPNGSRAFMWTRETGARNLGTLHGGNQSRASAINDADEVAGTSASANGDRAVVWTTRGEIRDLGTLPGDTSSEATAINNAGDVVGYSKGRGGLHAFLWNKSAGMQDLGALPGGNASRALGINDSGSVVGTSNSFHGDHAFIWTKESGMLDLNNVATGGPGVVFVEAQAINSGGKILAVGNASQQNAPQISQTNMVHPDDCAPAPAASFLLIPGPAK